MPAGGARDQRVQEGGHGAQGGEPRAGQGASARLREGVPADAKLGGFNGFRGVLCATRMLTSFLLTLLSWGVLHYRADPSAAAGDCAAYFGTVFASALARAQQRAAAEAGRPVASAGGGAGVMMHEYRRARGRGGGQGGRGARRRRGGGRRGGGPERGRAPGRVRGRPGHGER